MQCLPCDAQTQLINGPQDQHLVLHGKKKHTHTEHVEFLRNLVITPKWHKISK